MTIQTAIATTPPLSRVTQPVGTAHRVGRDGTERDGTAHLSQDTSLKTLVAELAAAIRAGECVSGQKRRSVSGQIYIFRVESAGALDMEERFKLCLRWMKETQVTNRRAFFAGCAEAGNNANLHHRCIKALKREGLIERIGREYVFKEE
jgi:hypothetical protein